MESGSEIITIKWLIVAILVCISIVAIAAVVIAAIFWQGFGIIKEQNQAKVFRLIAEDYLAKDSNEELLEHVEERLKSHPQDVWAHWYMGQVKYHARIYPESKRSFEKVLELEPSWYSSVDSWLEKIVEKLNEGPQLVE